MISTRLRHFTRTMWGLAPTESSTQRCSRISSSSSPSSSSTTSSSSYESSGVRDEHAQRQVEQVRRPVRAEQVARHLQQQVRAQAPTLAELLFSGKWDLSWRHIWQVGAKKWRNKYKKKETRLIPIFCRAFVAPVLPNTRRTADDLRNLIDDI